MPLRKYENSVDFILPDSLAEKSDIRKGDVILSVNSYPVRDKLDYISATSGEKILDFKIKRGAKMLRKEIVRERGKEIGIALAPMRVRRCRCRCIFCFYDQMPRGLRSSLYVKDDDYRFSFFFGSFITLTNLVESDWQKILGMRLSPLYISVHATDNDVRQKIMKYSYVQPIVESLKRLVDNGISLHTQIVLIPGYNDGEILERTIKDLLGLGEKILSIAVVPVGLTKYRKNLTHIKPVSRQLARKIVEWHYKFIRSNPLAFGRLQLADEFFILANEQIPSKSYYTDFPQYENGVGMVRYFHERAKLWRKQKFPDMSRKKIALTTGKLFAPILKKYAPELEQLTNAKIKVVLIENKFFGKQISVANLIAGCDFADVLKTGKFDAVLIPPKSAPENYFLDNISVYDLERNIKCAVVQAPNDPAELSKTFRNLIKRV